MESNFDVRLRILADVAILAADFACMDPIRGTVISAECTAARPFLHTI
jgi:hypothetical protein